MAAPAPNGNGEQVANWAYDIASRRDDAEFELSTSATTRCPTWTSDQVIAWSAGAPRWHRCVWRLRPLPPDP